MNPAPDLFQLRANVAGFLVVCRGVNPPIKLEYCDVWRYFARVVRALLRIAAGLHQGRSGPKKEWYIINQVPRIMRQTAHKSNPVFLHPFPQGDQENWLALAHFVAKDSQQNKAMCGHLVSPTAPHPRIRSLVPAMGWRCRLCSG